MTVERGENMSGGASQLQSGSMGPDAMHPIEDYELGQRIGAGAEGSVYIVTDRREGDNPSRKVMKKIYIGKRKKETLREAELLKKLDNPYVVRYIASFLDPSEEHLCIVTDFYAGGNLEQRICAQREAEKTFTEEEIMCWVVQIIQALRYLHHERILHRDLKTANIFLTLTDLIKVGDLGVAAQLDSSLDMRTTCVGSPYYLSPEVCQDVPYNTRSDMWSLGCCIYELATLRKAFKGNNLLSVVNKICSCKYEAVDESCPEGVAHLITSLLQVEPNDRPTTVELLDQDYVRTYLAVLTHRLEAHQLLSRRRMTHLDFPELSGPPSEVMVEEMAASALSSRTESTHSRSIEMASEDSGIQYSRELANSWPVQPVGGTSEHLLFTTGAGRHEESGRVDVRQLMRRRTRSREDKAAPWSDGHAPVSPAAREGLKIRGQAKGAISTPSASASPADPAILCEPAATSASVAEATSCSMLRGTNPTPTDLASSQSQTPGMRQSSSVSSSISSSYTTHHPLIVTSGATSASANIKLQDGLSGAPAQLQHRDKTKSLSMTHNARKPVLTVSLPDRPATTATGAVRRNSLGRSPATSKPKARNGQARPASSTLTRLTKTEGRGPGVSEEKSPLPEKKAPVKRTKSKSKTKAMPRAVSHARVAGARGSPAASGSTTKTTAASKPGGKRVRKKKAGPKGKKSDSSTSAPPRTRATNGGPKLVIKRAAAPTPSTIEAKMREAQDELALLQLETEAAGVMSSAATEDSLMGTNQVHEDNAGSGSPVAVPEDLSEGYYLEESFESADESESDGATVACFEDSDGIGSFSDGEAGNTMVPDEYAYDSESEPMSGSDAEGEYDIMAAIAQSRAILSRVANYDDMDDFSSDMPAPNFAGQMRARLQEAMGFHIFDRVHDFFARFAATRPRALSASRLDEESKSELLELVEGRAELLDLCASVAELYEYEARQSASSSPFLHLQGN